MTKSILNDVLGPVMRGPSSSHTAASWRIGRYAGVLLEEPVRSVTITFDSEGSYGQVYAQQGSDRAFVCGLLGWEMEDGRFHRTLAIAPEEGMDVSFAVDTLAGAEHPNDVELRLAGATDSVVLRARSIGGGAVEFVSLDGLPYQAFGDSYDLLIGAPAEDEPSLSGTLPEGELSRSERDGRVLVHLRTAEDPTSSMEGIRAACPSASVRCGPALLYPFKGKPLFDSAEGMVHYAEQQGIGLGEAGLRYEATLLGLTESEALEEMRRRYRVMKDAVALGLSGESGRMRLLPPSAGGIMERERRGALPQGGLHTRAAARAMAALHVNSSMGVVCAGPTGGAAGVVSGVSVTLEEEWGLSEEDVVRALFAAGAVGLIVAIRATFAAEVAGCQAEIGVAGGMTAAMVADAAGRSPEEACNAAAVALQNTMGSVCDLVQGCVEIPCHTRNGVAASMAFVDADLVAGGYGNPVPLDETIDACYASGRMLPSELRCTARGGLAVCPSALRMQVGEI
ncbi:MAG: L-serine ammonia-lyase, iron-sulfur-dependent, subunit alpha [Synergistales bacterium]|nr:L-serine ammonia-lyase, iron-sulfur-dependent, subunit alpha [Synergistales bacterium]